ncbi:diaphanous 2 [Triplophysa rosa]|uniref:Diaphanous 2 n=1 Tax=Triplophysa rosa TaxID=992332 RepID=A0A9W7WJJ2_TRIRA|nr:diaphanous 2 [Triplophysa rosa]
MPQPLFDERSMNLSEKEIIDLFEKMMEDMNLNEERKAPLRGKDLSTKREMVVQYISATAKSITGSKVAGSTLRPMLFSIVCDSVPRYIEISQGSERIDTKALFIATPDLISCGVSVDVSVHSCNHDLAYNFNAIQSSANIEMSSAIRLIQLNRSERAIFSLATTDAVLHLKHSRLPRRLPVASSANHSTNKVWHLSAAHFMVVIHGRSVVSRHYLLIKHALSAQPNGHTDLWFDQERVTDCLVFRALFLEGL